MNERDNNMADNSLQQTGQSSNWAAPVNNFKANVTESNAPNRVDGKHLLGALQGFGPMWQKTYTMHVPARFSPTYVIQTWKENFGSFWPKGNRFYSPFSGIKPGEVALIKGSVPGGLQLSTGVMVIYSDDESFAFMTPQGHVFAGWVTFRAYSDGNKTIIQVQVLMRSPDPIIELGLRMGGHRAEDKVWFSTLENLGKHLGIETTAKASKICLDRSMQWREIRNLRHNAIIGSTVYTLTAPLRWMSAAARRPHR